MTNLQSLVFLAFLSTIFATVLSLWRKLMSVHDKIVLLATKVDALKTVVDGAVATLNGLSEQIRETAGDEDAALALADSIDAETASLAAAIANVPPVVAPAPKGVEVVKRRTGAAAHGWPGGKPDTFGKGEGERG